MAQPSSVPPAGANGVLPVPVHALQKNTSAPANGAPRGASHRSQQPRLKIVVRRLAPGLTQQEFEAALGDEWQLGQGKVDWFTYKAGKISKDLAKPSKPSRAYFHLTDKTHLVPLADQVRKTAFNDAKNSTRDPALIGPPSVEFAPFNRTPGGRRRHDARQGLIDQDPEFKDFLESLTNPVTKPAPGDPAAEDVAVKKEEVKTTPLIEHIREKKAAKEKPQPAKAQGKQHGRGESKDEKAASKADKKSRKGGKEEKGSKQSKAEKAGKESTPKDVKILNKGSAGKNAEPEKTDENKPAPSAPALERKRERGNASIAKQMLQRDLGIGPAAGGRRGRRDTAQEPAKTAETTAPKEPAASSPATSSPAAAAAAPTKAGSEARSGKKDSRPTRAERRAQKAAKANAETTTDASKPAAAPAPAPPTGPKILKKPQNAQQQGQKGSPAANTPASDASATAPPLKAPTGPAAQQQSPASSCPTSSRNANNNAATAATPATSTARQAFLKHANPSQGITEPLIETALAVFGAIEKVEIDKRKGFAYVDFAEPAGLQKAIAASPVKVAEGAVQVLERKDKTPAQRAPRVPPAGAPAGPMMGGRGSGGGGGGGSGSFRGGRGGRGRVGGGGSANAPAATAAAAAATTAAAPAATPAAPAAKTPAPVADTPS